MPIPVWVEDRGKAIEVIHHRATQDGPGIFWEAPRACLPEAGSPASGSSSRRPRYRAAASSNVETQGGLGRGHREYAHVLSPKSADLFLQGGNPDVSEDAEIAGGSCAFR